MTKVFVLDDKNESIPADNIELIGLKMVDSVADLLLEFTYPASSRIGILHVSLIVIKVVGEESESTTSISIGDLTAQHLSDTMLMPIHLFLQYHEVSELLQEFLPPVTQIGMKLVSEDSVLVSLSFGGPRSITQTIKLGDLKEYVIEA